MCLTGRVDAHVLCVKRRVFPGLDCSWEVQHCFYIFENIKVIMRCKDKCHKCFVLACFCFGEFSGEFLVIFGESSGSFGKLLGGFSGYFGECSESFGELSE